MTRRRTPKIQDKDDKPQGTAGGSDEKPQGTEEGSDEKPQGTEEGSETAGVGSQDDPQTTLVDPANTDADEAGEFSDDERGKQEKSQRSLDRLIRNQETTLVPVIRKQKTPMDVCRSLHHRYRFLLDAIIIISFAVLFPMIYGGTQNCSCPENPDSIDLTDIKGRLSKLEDEYKTFSTHTLQSKLASLKNELTDDITEMSNQIEPLMKSMGQIEGDFKNQIVTFNAKVKEVSQIKDNIVVVIDTFKDDYNKSIGQTVSDIKQQQESFHNGLKTEMMEEIQDASSKIPTIVEEKVASYIDGKWNEYLHQIEGSILKSDLFQNLKDGLENVTSQTVELFNETNIQRSQIHRSEREGIRIRKLINLLNEKYSEANHKINSVKKEAVEGVAKLNSSLRENTKHEVTHLSTLLTSKFNTELGEIKSWMEDVKRWKREEINPAIEKLASMRGSVEYLNQQGSETTVVVYGVVAIIMCLVVLVIFLMWKLQNVTQQTVRADKKPLYTPEIFLNRVKPDIANDMSVCCLSFNDSTQNLHHQLTTSVLRDQDGFKMKTYHLGSHDRILQIPPSKICIVYVDHNDRNVILEDQESELGDIRRTTVEALRKMGAIAVVVYIHDEGSKFLRDGILYNPRLSSIKRHPVLSKLDGKGRVLSVYDSFTEYQKECLQQLIDNARQNL